MVWSWLKTHYNQQETTVKPCPLTTLICILAFFVCLHEKSCDVAAPWQCFVSLHCTLLCCLHPPARMYFGMFGVIMFNASAIPSEQNPIQIVMILKLFLVSVKQGSFPQYIIHSGKADVPLQSWCRDPSPCKQVNLQLRRLLRSRVVLWQSVFTPGKLDAMQFVSIDFSAGHLPHLLSSIKTALRRYCQWYRIM